MPQGHYDRLGVNDYNSCEQKNRRSQYYKLRGTNISYPEQTQLLIDQDRFHIQFFFVNLILYAITAACVYFMRDKYNPEKYNLLPIFIFIIVYFVFNISCFKIYKFSYLNKIKNARHFSQLRKVYQRLIQDPGRLVVSLSKQNCAVIINQGQTHQVSLPPVLMYKQQYKLKSQLSQQIDIKKYLSINQLTCVTFKLEPKRIDNITKDKINSIVYEFKCENKNMIDSSTKIQTKFQCGENELERQIIYYTRQNPYVFYTVGYIIFAAFGMMWLFDLYTNCSIKIKTIKIPKYIELE